MRAYDHDTKFSVAIYVSDVQMFNMQHPAAQLPERSLLIEFDKKSGLIIELHPHEVAEQIKRCQTNGLFELARKFGYEQLAAGKAEALKITRSKTKTVKTTRERTRKR